MTDDSWLKTDKLWMMRGDYWWLMIDAVADVEQMSMSRWADADADAVAVTVAVAEHISRWAYEQMSIWADANAATDAEQVSIWADEQMLMLMRLWPLGGF